MLAAPKSASSTVVRALLPHAQMVLTGQPKLKHVNVGQFEKYVEPLLRFGRYPREEYELVSIFREPIDTLRSWWRFRGRPQLRNDPARYTGNTSFEDFALARLERAAQASIRTQTSFLQRAEGGVLGIDRLLQFERTDVWQRYLREKVGEDLQFGRYKATSREAHRHSPDLTDETERRLRQLFAPEYEVFGHLVAGDGQWTPPQGYVPKARTLHQ
jgi:hypothetical protein